MIINIRRKPLTDEQIEQLKFDFIIKNNPSLPITYNWNLKGESPNESLEDFHLFCLSIVRELFTENFKTNEHGQISYDLKEIDTEATLDDLNYLYQVIADKKIRNI